MNFLRIKELHLRNITCYGSQRISFTQGNNILLGHNGSGKSSILNAIGIGLFGTKYLNGMPFKIKDIVTRGLNSGKITLQFETRSGTYMSEFTIGERSNRWELYRYDPKIGHKSKISSTITETEKNIQNLLGQNIDEKTFKNAICSPQGSIDKLLSSSDSERGDEIRKVLGLEKFNVLETHMRNIARKFRNEIEVMERERRTLEERVDVPEEVERELKERRAQLEVIREEEKKLKLAIQGIKAELEKLEGDIRKREDILSRMDTTQKTIREISERIASGKSSLDELIRSEKLSSDYEEIIRERDSVQKRILEVTEEITQLQSRLQTHKKNAEKVRTLAEEISKKTKILEEKRALVEKILGGRKTEEIKGEREELQGELSVLTQAIQQAEERIKQVQREIADLQKQEGDVTAEVDQTRKKFRLQYGAELSEKETIRQKLTGEHEDLVKRAKEEEERVESLTNDIVMAQAKIKEVTQVLDLISVSDPSTKDCPTCLRRFEGIDIGSIKARHEDTRDELERKVREHKEELRGSKEKLEGLRKQEREIREKIVRLDSFDLPGIQKLEKKVMEIREKVMEREKEKKTHTTTLEKLQAKRPREMEKKIKQYDEVLSDIEKLRREISSLETEISVRQGEQKSLTEEINTFDVAGAETILSTKQKEKEETMQRRKVLTDAVEYITKIRQRQEDHKRQQDMLLKLKESLKNYPEIEKKRIDEIKVNYGLKIQELGKVNEKIRQIEETDIPELEAKLKRAREDRTRLGQLASDISRYKKAMDTYGVLRDLFEEIPNRLLHKTVESVSRVMTQRMQSMYPHRNINKVILKPNGELIIHIAGQKVDIKTLSGGERTALALSLRIALSMHVAPLEFMILDEPTNHMDKNRIEELVTIIENKTLLNSPNGQLLLVTHRDEFESAANQIIHIEEEVDGSRKVTIR